VEGQIADSGQIVANPDILSIEVEIAGLPVIRTKLRSSLIRRSRIPVWPQNQIWGSWAHFLVQSLS
jgi:hypothetical protein